MSSSLIALFTFSIGFIASIYLDKEVYEKVFMVNYIVVLGAQVLIFGKNYSIYKAEKGNFPLSKSWFYFRAIIIASIFLCFSVIENESKWLLIPIFFVIVFQLYASLKRIQGELYKSVFFDKINQVTCSLVLTFFLLGFQFANIEKGYLIIFLLFSLFLIVIDLKGFILFFKKIEGGRGSFYFNSYEAKVSLGVFTLLLVNVVDKIIIGYFSDDGILASWLVMLQIYFVLSIFAQSIFSYFIKEDGENKRKKPKLLLWYFLLLILLSILSTFILDYFYLLIYKGKFDISFIAILFVNLSGGFLIFQQILSAYVITQMNENEIRKVSVNTLLVSLCYLLGVICFSISDTNQLLKISIAFFCLSVFKALNFLFYYYKGYEKCFA